MELPFWSRACLLTFISNWLYNEGHDLKIIFYLGGKVGVVRLYFCFHKERRGRKNMIRKKKIEELKKMERKYYQLERENEDKIEYFKKELKDPLNDFIVEVITERLDKGLNQEKLANKMGTKQPVISRFENLGRKPSYEFMERLAKVLGGNLYITIHGDYTLTAPKEYRKKLDLLSKETGKSPKELMMNFLEQGIKMNFTIPVTLNLTNVDWSLIPIKIFGEEEVLAV